MIGIGVRSFFEREAILIRIKICYVPHLILLPGTERKLLDRKQS